MGGQGVATDCDKKNRVESGLAGGSSAQNAFVSVLLVPKSSSGPKAVLLFSTYIGGGFRIPGSHENETIHGLSVDANHTIYGYGRTLSDSLFGHTSPATAGNGFQTQNSHYNPTHPHPSGRGARPVLPSP